MASGQRHMECGQVYIPARGQARRRAFARIGRNPLRAFSISEPTEGADPLRLKKSTNCLTDSCSSGESELMTAARFSATIFAFHPQYTLPKTVAPQEHGFANSSLNVPSCSWSFAMQSNRPFSRRCDL
jgi:hypothetical protein